MGLLLPHIRTVYLYADMMIVKGSGSGEALGGGKRKAISEFTGESRFRLFQLLHSLTYETVTFVTLTYPKVFPVDGKEFKAHLKAFKRRVERIWGKMRAVWRLEFQKRGAPHFHIIYLDAPFMPVENLCSIWCEVIRTDDLNARKISVDVKAVVKSKQQKLVMTYLSKYAAKMDGAGVPEGTVNVGRFWGRWNITVGKESVFLLTSHEAASLVGDVVHSDDSRGSWEPTRLDVCTIFGATMGSDRFAIDVQERVARLQHRELLSDT